MRSCRISGGLPCSVVAVGLAAEALEARVAALGPGSGSRHRQLVVTRARELRGEERTHAAWQLFRRALRRLMARRGILPWAWYKPNAIAQRRGRAWRDAQGSTSVPLLLAPWLAPVLAVPC
eukprot:460246-Prymnesium_polylepis.1